MSTKCQIINASFDLSYLDGSAPFSGDLTLTGFNVSLGIGDGSATLDLSLIVNPCIGNNSWTAGGVGRVLRFRSLTTDFEFNGIVNSATLSEGAEGKILNYKVVDPRKLLGGVGVLLKDYYCRLSAPNFMSFIYEQESGVAVCPPSADSQNWPEVGNCANYGTSGILNNSSQNGISLLKVLQKIQSYPDKIWTTSGLGSDRLSLDLSRLITIVSQRAPWSKTDSTSMTVDEIISQAASDAGCDFITTISRTGVIIVWPIDRTLNIGSNPIDGIIAAYKAAGTLINSEAGRNEIYAPSNRVVIGDHVTYMTEVDCRNTGKASMMLGYDTDGVPVRASGPNFTASINTTSLRALPNLQNFQAMTEISENEILASKTAQLWLVYGAVNPNTLSRKLMDALGLTQVVNAGPFNLANIFNQLANANPADPDTVNGWKEKLLALKNGAGVAAQKFNYNTYVQCWKWFQEFINTYYGRKWLVKINKFCVYPGNNATVIIGDGGPYQVSDVPTDSGYPSVSQQTNGILGLPQDKSVVFEAADGKYSGFIKVDTSKVYTRTLVNNNPINFKITADELSAGNFIVEGNALYMKVENDRIVYSNNGDPEVLITSPIIPMVPNIPPENQNDFVNRGLMAMAALFGVNKFQNRGQGNDQGGGYMNISKLNIFQLNNLAAEIDFVTIPMKSNVYVYGPWTSQSPTIGSTEVMVESSLNPWNYGSISAMQIAGQALADMGIRPTNIEYTGSFKIAEPPGKSINDFITQYGLLVSNITVSYGQSGVTTDVAFKTFIPRFGQFGKVLSEMMLKSVQQRSVVSSYFKNMRRDSIREMYSLQIGAIKEMMKIHEDKIADQGTPTFLMVGGYRGSKPNSTDSGGSSFDPPSPKNQLTCQEICNPPPPPSEPGDGGTCLGKIPEVDMEIELNPELGFSDDDVRFKQKSAMSLDGLFTPISINGRTYNRVGVYYKGWSDGGFRPRPPMPPFKERLSINQKYLNPIVSKTMLGQWDSRKSGSDEGFYIQYISFGDNIQKIHNNDERDNATDFGFFALRGPLVLQAWGYDTEGKPIPNIIDSPANAENGVFNPNGTKNKFMKNWLNNPKTWPSGPIDLRFDRERGVWVAPTQERIVVAQLMSTLNPYGSAIATLLNPESGGGQFYENYAIWGPNGENYGKNINTIKITVCDFLGRTLCSGTKIYAYYNDNKYIVLESSAVDETPCSAQSCECSETSSSESSSETSEPCPDYCGLNSCLQLINYYKTYPDPSNTHLIAPSDFKQILVHNSEGCLEWADIIAQDVIVNVFLSQTGLDFERKTLLVLNTVNADPVVVPISTCASSEPSPYSP